MQVVDVNLHVPQRKRVMASDAIAATRVLACVAAPAGDGFVVANGGQKLSRHGFPLNTLEVKSSE